MAGEIFTQRMLLMIQEKEVSGPLIKLEGKIWSNICDTGVK